MCGNNDQEGRWWIIKFVIIMSLNINSNGKKMNNNGVWVDTGWTDEMV